MEIAEKIKKLRNLYGLTQGELGKLGGVSVQAVSSWEKGERSPKFGPIQDICRHFGIDANRFIDVTNDYYGQDEPGRDSSPAPMDPELEHLLESLRTRPEMRMLFDLADNATAEDVRKAVAIIEALMREDGR